MTTKTIGAIALFLGSIAMLARCWAPRVDIVAERDSVERSVCSQVSLAAASHALDTLGFRYDVDAARSRLRSIRQYRGMKTLLPTITVELHFDSSGKTTSCNVETVIVDR
jgi:hypothetical protein